MLYFCLIVTFYTTKTVPNYKINFKNFSRFLSYLSIYKYRAKITNIYI